VKRRIRLRDKNNLLTLSDGSFTVLFLRVFSGIDLKTQLQRLIIGVIVLFIAPILAAETQPKFTIIPSTSTHWIIPSNGQTSITYTVTNQTKIKRTLVMKPIPGITQQTLGAGVCSNPFTLNPGQSCQLVLPIIGSQITGQHITAGPVICKTQGPGNNLPDPFLCSDACNGNQLDLTGVGFEAAKLSISPASLSLIINGAPGSFTITNHSTTVTASNVVSQFSNPPGVPAGWVSYVTFNSSGCISIPPNGTCTVTFSPKSILTSLPTPSSQIFNYQGSNTTPVSVTVKWGFGLAKISATPTFLALLVGGIGQLVTVTNLSDSVYALNVAATLPASYTDVTQLPIGCSVIAPGSSCFILISPGPTIHVPQPPEYTYIKGSNTTKVKLDVVVESGAATIAITAPLAIPPALPSVVVVQYGPSVSLTLKNVSSTPIDALSVGTSNIAITTINPFVTQSTDCPAALPQGQSCHLFFTPNNVGTHGPTPITIPDPAVNTNTVQANITVANTHLTISPSQMVLATQNTFAGGSNTRVITITNPSTADATAVTYVSTLPPDATITQVPALCLNSIPANGGTCNLHIKAGDTPTIYPSGEAKAETITLSGPTIGTDVNVIPVTILTYMVNWNNEGVVYSIDDTTPSNQSVNFNIVSDTAEDINLPWAPSACAATNPNCPSTYTFAPSFTNGLTNTAGIVAAYSSFATSSYAAGICYSKETDHSWYLPAICDLTDLPAGSTTPIPECATVSQNMLKDTPTLIQDFQIDSIDLLWGSTLIFDYLPLTVSLALNGSDTGAFAFPPQGIPSFNIPSAVVCVKQIIPAP
jgi:hypothetical protein